LPSTEPNRRNFSFDVIPSALVDNVTVAKTFTPDMPGEFVGGLVEVNTLAVPDEQFLTVTAGTGMNTNSTGKDFLSNTRYSGDWLFGDIDSRQWYAGGSEEQVDMGIANAAQKNNYGLRRYTAAPVQNYELSVGLPFALGENQRLGVVAALSYRNQQTIEDILETHTITRDSLWQESWRNKFVTATGAVLNMGWESPNQQITWRNLFNNRFSHTNQERYMNKYYEGYDIVEQYSVPLQSRLWQTQLEGEHKLAGNLKANWNLSYSKVTRTNPDDRLATARVQGYMADGSPAFNWSLATSNTNIQTIIDSHTMYSRLEESKKNAGFDLEYRFKLHQLNQKLKLGYLGSFRKASFEQQYLKAQGGNTEAYGLPVQDYFAPENFGDSGFLSYSRSGLSTSHADYYQGEQNIHAAYLMGELTPMAKLHFTLGSRMEKAKTSVTTLTYRDDGGGRTDSLIVLNKTSWLPAASLVYNVTSNFNARLAWSQTLARPDFRELSLNTYYNVDDRVSVYNQGAIKQSSTDNYDFRLEWYPHPGEVISAGLFYKKFSDPVEIVTRMTSSQQSFYMYPVNIDEATAKGVELNLRKSLGFMAPGSLLENLYFSGNFSLIEGDVTYSLADVLGLDRIDRQERSRPLAGLAPYLVNGGLSYEGKVFGWSVNYNREGRKLVYAGEYDKHDQYENPRDVLDLQVSARLLRQKLELKLNAGDILNQDVIIYRNCDYDPLNDPAVDPGVYHDRTGLGMDYNEGDWLMSRVKKGVNLSFSVSYKL
jgi:TonB-dependent receptor